MLAGEFTTLQNCLPAARQRAASTPARIVQTSGAPFVCGGRCILAVLVERSPSKVLALSAGWTPLAMPQRAASSSRRSPQCAASSGGGGPADPPPPGGATEQQQQQQQAPGGSSMDSDAVFLAKMAGGSFALGACIKYGSLLVDVPFQPTATAALFLVLSPPIVWAALRLAKPE